MIMIDLDFHCAIHQSAAVMRYGYDLFQICRFVVRFRPGIVIAVTCKNVHRLCICVLLCTRSDCNSGIPEFRDGGV